MHDQKLAREKLVAIIDDNCPVNKLLAILIEIPLLDCRSHRFNLGVKSYTETQLKP